MRSALLAKVAGSASPPAGGGHGSWLALCRCRSLCRERERCCGVGVVGSLWLVAACGLLSAVGCLRET